MITATIVCTARGVRRAATRRTMTSETGMIARMPTARVNQRRRVCTAPRRAESAEVAVEVAVVAEGAVVTATARAMCRSE
jgi:hypothetical protein